MYRQLDHADLLVVIYAGQNEEDTRPLRPALPQSAQPKQDRSLILLHNLRICQGFVNNTKLFGYFSKKVVRTCKNELVRLP